MKYARIYRLYGVSTDIRTKDYKTDNGLRKAVLRELSPYSNTKFVVEYYVDSSRVSFDIVTV